MSSEGVRIPDLLRRFVATPHTFTAGVDENSVRLETNDRAILSEFQSQVQYLPRSYTWKLIRDDATSTGQETTVIVSGPLLTVLLGTETWVVVDRERRQVVGFVASDVNAGKLLNRLSSIFAESASVKTEIGEQQHCAPGC